MTHIMILTPSPAAVKSGRKCVPGATGAAPRRCAVGALVQLEIVQARPNSFKLLSLPDLGGGQAYVDGGRSR